MGWLSSTAWPTRTAIRDHVRSELIESGNIIKKDALVGNHYWAAVTAKDGRTCIFLALLRSDGPNYGWGYKDMDEFSGPYETDIPLSVLNAADPLDRFTDYGPGLGYAKSFREKAYAAISEKSRRKGLLKGLKPGDVVTLANTKANPFTIVTIEPLRGYGADGMLYRLPKSRLSSVGV